MGSIYKRGKTYWIKYYRNGKPYRESSESKKEADAKRLLKKREGEISNGKLPGIYFDKVILGGLSAQFVLVMALSQEQQMAMYQRGARVSNLGDGKKKVTLTGEDLHTVFATPIASLAYLTRTRLDDELLLKRFGEPAQRIRESENNTTHWLYPELGLDVALNDEGRAVLQYVSPKDFSGLMEPLLKLETQP